MLEKTREGKYAADQFNTDSLRWTKSMLPTAEELKFPVILDVLGGVGKYTTGFETVAATVETMMEELNITVPVALHLDHGAYDGHYKCTKTGFSSTVLDNSRYPIEENIEKTGELVKVAHAMGLSLGAEVGSIGDGEDGVVGLGEYADPQEHKVIADLGIGFLAAGTDNIHGKCPENWPGLRLDILEQVEVAADDMPLVLHGGTDIPEDMIKKIIGLGVTEIDVDTECQLSFAATTREYIEAGKDLKGKGSGPGKLLAPGADTVRATVKGKMEPFGSVGEA